MVGVIIGSGIFRTPPALAAEFASPGFILALWVAGGLLCLAGAFTYAELAAMHPHSGGVYVFIREGFGDCTAFVFGWAYLVLVKPFAAGGIAFIFGEHINQLFGVHWDVRISTTIMLLSLTVINIRGVTLSTGFAGVLTFLKFGALAAIIALAIVLGRTDTSKLAAAPVPPSPDLIKSIVLAMSAILWTYDGWADVGSIAGEVKDPQRQLPRIYILGTLAVIGIYVAVNAAYFMLVPLEEMRSQRLADSQFSVAPLVMERLIGPSGSIAVVLIVLCSTLGSSHASIMTGARVSYAQARDGLLFRFIAHVHPKWHTPDASLISQVLLSIVAVWFLGSFQALAESFVFTMWIFYAMAGAALFILRIKSPTAHRPFRCPGYPIVPALFVAAAVAMTILSITGDTTPKQFDLLPFLGTHKHMATLPWLAILAAGVPIYSIWRRLAKEPLAPGAARRP
jgi:amino acid transporter